NSHAAGDINGLPTLDALAIAGFSAVSCQLTYSNTECQVDLTLHATANYVVAKVIVDGFIDFNHSQFQLIGTADVGIAGFTLSNTIFTATNIGGLKVALHSHTSIVNIGSVDFDGTLTQSGSSYVLLVHGMASF